MDYLETRKTLNIRRTGTSVESHRKQRSGAKNHTVSKENVYTLHERKLRPSNKGRRQNPCEWREGVSDDQKIGTVDGAFRTREAIRKQRGSPNDREPPRKGAPLIRKYTSSKGKRSTNVSEGRGRSTTLTFDTDQKPASRTLNDKTINIYHQGMKISSSKRHKNTSSKAASRTPALQARLGSSYTLGPKKRDTESSTKTSTRVMTRKRVPGTETHHRTSVSRTQTAEAGYTRGTKKRDTESSNESSKRSVMPKRFSHHRTSTSHAQNSGVNHTLDNKKRDTDSRETTKRSGNRESRTEILKHIPSKASPRTAFSQAQNSEASYTLDNKKRDTDSRETTKRSGNRESRTEVLKHIPSKASPRTAFSQAQNSEANYTLGNEKRDTDSRILSKRRESHERRTEEPKRIPSKGTSSTGDHASKQRKNGAVSPQRGRGRSYHTENERDTQGNDGAEEGGGREKEDSGDEDLLLMFLSTDYLEKEEAYHNGLRDSSGGGGRERQQELPDHHHPHFSEQAKQKHEEIIRQILDEFDLEETKDKYRNANACELQRKGTSLDDFKFRSELMRLMGSEVIRLNDSAWTTKFQQRLNDDYEKRLDLKEQTLANREQQRVHQLRLEGITEEGAVAKDKDLLENAFSVCYFRPCRSSKYPFARPRIDNKWPVNRKKTFKDETSRIRESELSARSSARRYQPPVKTILEESNRTAPEEDRHDVDSQKRESTLLGSSEIFPSAARQGQVEMQSYSSTLVKREFSRTERRKNLLKRHPPHVIRLYEAETVSSLYNCAEQIVGSPRGPKNFKENKTTTADK